MPDDLDLWRLAGTADAWGDAPWQAPEPGEHADADERAAYIARRQQLGNWLAAVRQQLGWNCHFRLPLETEWECPLDSCRCEFCRQTGGWHPTDPPCDKCGNSGWIEWTENQSPLGSGYYWPETFREPCICAAGEAAARKEEC